MTKIEKAQLARYIRTTWMLSAKTDLEFSDFCEIHYFSALEAKKLGTQVRKENVFARHYKGIHFYVQRARELGDHTVIEVFLPGDPKSMGNEAESIAANFEMVAVLSSTIAMYKKDLHRRLGISSNPRTELDFNCSPDFYSISSKSRSTPNNPGISIDETFCNRFSRCGFATLVDYVLSNSEFANRVSLSLDWLFDSRTEPRLNASVVKTAIALESLLIFNESESLAQSLSERAAFILSSDPNRRKQISKIIKVFYDARSGVVHGSQKKLKKLTPMLLESVDRLVIMLCLMIASNSNFWPTIDALRDWCEDQRWGEPSKNINIPFPDLYLKNAMNLSQKDNHAPHHHPYPTLLPHQIRP